jgi:uncharacterized HAD superfamily protein
VDFDDVLCETAQAFLDVVEREFGRRYAFEEIRFFDLEKSFHLNQAEYDYMMGLIHDPATLRIMEPMPGVEDVLNAWHGEGVEIAVVTGRPPETEAVCHEWLEQRAFPYDRLLFVDKYGRTPPHKVGVEVIVPQDLKDMGFTLAVEDAPAMIEFLIRETDIPLAVLDRPWNRNLALSDVDERVVRCEDWSAVAEAFSARVRCSA